MDGLFMIVVCFRLNAINWMNTVRTINEMFAYDISLILILYNTSYIKLISFEYNQLYTPIMYRLIPNIVSAT